MPHILIFLLRYARLTGEEGTREIALHTLDSMYRGGLFDHVGGGFSRYSTDRRWLIPHFEKMLYDNALLALAYTEAFQHTRRPIYEEIIRRTLDYVLREPEGMAVLREKVYAYRLARTALHRDDKVLTVWNGLALAALVRAGLMLDEPRYLEAARRTENFLAEKLTGPGGRLLARWRDRDAAYPGKLDDYAFYAYGLLELYGATFDISYFACAAELAGKFLEPFFDWEHGGFYPYASDGEQLLTRIKEACDGAMPSGNSVASLVLSRLVRLTGEGRWREAADRQLRWLAGTTADYPARHSFAMLAFLEELWPSSELVVAAQEIPKELRAFLRGKPHPGLTVLVKTPENAGALTAVAPFTKGYPIQNGGRGTTCARVGSASSLWAELLSWKLFGNQIDEKASPTSN